MAGTGPSAAQVAADHRVDGTCIYLLGTFDLSVTVLGQQNRALNLAWALIDSHIIPAKAATRIAVIGAGFAGLTFAAALMKKDVGAKVTIFEERDTLLPLQQGSDTRWLHPNIYDWPASGSDASVAMLPVLNWNAGRASDVVVQVLSEWRSLIEDAERKTRPRLFCNTRHLQILPISDASAGLEWVGEQRECADGTTLRDSSSIGSSETFDIVILAVGFGAERENQLSYWRNETYGQPSLSQQHRTFLISGQGDGAMIDLLRLRVSQYRQDRILADLFNGKKALVQRLNMLREQRYAGGESLFRRFERLRKGADDAAKQIRQAQKLLAHRLRRDTDAILHLQVRNLEDLFAAEASRTSFQNALLVYLLYCCGGFVPSNESESDLIKRYGIAEDDIIRRHGTHRGKQLERILPLGLYDEIKPHINNLDSAKLRQSAERRWPGGYLGFPGPTSGMLKLGDPVRRTWRKEYLPSATILVADTVCGAVAGLIDRMKPSVDHFRLTLHRVLPLHGEELLQQACDYRGRKLANVAGTAARIFPVNSGTIGLAYRERAIVRSKAGVSPEDLVSAMQALELRSAARKMAPGVRFLLAIPVLQPNAEYVGANPVAAMLYLDSQDEGFWLDDTELAAVASVLQHSAADVWDSAQLSDRLSNVPLADIHTATTESSASVVPEQLELVALAPPRTNFPRSFNFDYSELTPRADSEAAVTGCSSELQT